MADKGMTRSTSEGPDLQISERHREILNASAILFAEYGYKATSMREIGKNVGLLGGSLYHYIKSKEALFVKIHDLALQGAADRIRTSFEDAQDPWERLEKACLTLLEVQLDPESQTVPLMNDLDAVPPHVRLLLIAKRDAFEQIFVNLIDGLPLARDIDRSIYRILLLTLLNNVVRWYRPSRLSIKQVSDQIILIFRHEAGLAHETRSSPSSSGSVVNRSPTRP